MVVGVLPATEVALEAGDGGSGVGAVVEFFAVGAVGPLDATVELGAAGWEFDEEDALLLAGVLEAGHEFRAAVDLDGADRKRAAFDECLQCFRGEVGGGVGGNRRHGPAADDINGGELLEDDPWLRTDIHRIYLDDVAGKPGLVTFRFASGVLAFPGAAVGGEAVQRLNSWRVRFR